MPPAKKTETDPKPGTPKDEKATEAPRDDRAEVVETEAGPIRTDRPEDLPGADHDDDGGLELSADEKVDTLKELSTDTPLEERAAALEDMPRVDPTRLIGQRAVFDTSGTAGPADHDVRRASAAWDRDILATEEDIPDHLKKYVDGPEGLPHMIKNAYNDEEANKDRDDK
jgi:hypothetical protein